MNTNFSDVDLDELHDTSIEDLSETSSSGEMSVSGDTPDPEADDDTLKNAHRMGLGLDEDYDSPKPLNIAEDVEEAERSRRGG